MPVIAAIGIFVEVLVTTRFAQKLSYLILNLASGQLWLILLMMVVVCLVFGLGMPTLSTISKIPFAERASTLIGLLEARDAFSDAERNLLIGLKCAASLVKTRNLIAHNPLMMDTYVKQNETEMRVDHSIRSFRSATEVLDISQR